MPKTKRLSQITAVQCPCCSATCQIDEPTELAINDVLSCDQCNADLVVITLDPLAVAEAEETDDEDDDLDDEEMDEEDEELEDEDEDDLDDEDEE